MNNNNKNLNRLTNLLKMKRSITNNNNSKFWLLINKWWETMRMNKNNSFNSKNFNNKSMS